MAYRSFRNFQLLSCIVQSPPKESIHLRQSQVLKTEEGYRKCRGYDTPSIELVQTGPSLGLKFKKIKTGLFNVFVGLQPFLWVSKWGLAQIGPPTFHLAPSILSTQLDKSVYFLSVETVAWYHFTIEFCPIIRAIWILFFIQNCITVNNNPS